MTVVITRYGRSIGGFTANASSILPAGRVVIPSFNPNKMGHNEDMTGIEVYTISFSSL
jgi:hypothetical protein